MQRGRYTRAHIRVLTDGVCSHCLLFAAEITTAGRSSDTLEVSNTVRTGLSEYIVTGGSFRIFSSLFS